MTQPLRPHRPVFRDPGVLEYLGEPHDPFATIEAAHETAAVLLHEGHAADDPAVVTRLVTLVDQLGLSTLAELWAQRPARTLPGVLWRLYVLREWMIRAPGEAARDYHFGTEYAEAHHAVAGVDPPGPDEVRAVADAILAGAFTGDVGDALDRASAFVRVVVAGRAHAGQGLDSALGALRLRDMADDLTASAALWRAGRLT